MADGEDLEEAVDIPEDGVAGVGTCREEGEVLAVVGDPVEEAEAAEDGR